MSLSAQRSVVESFNFSCKHVRSVYVKDVDQCPVSKDVYEAIGYEKEDGVKAIQRLVPKKYKLDFGETMIDMKEASNIRLYKYTVLLSGHDLKLFLMRCRKPNALIGTKHFGIKIEHCLPASKVQDALNQMVMI